MSSQADFWKPKPYDFEGLVAGVNIEQLAPAYISRAKAHAETIIRWPAAWDNLERFHDLYDKANFEHTSIAPETDIWDNRRKVAAK